MNEIGRAQEPHILQVHYGDEIISFEVRTQPARLRQSLSIHVQPDGRVVVDTPLDVDEGRVLSAVKRRSWWISQQLQNFRDLRAHALPQEYVSGESLLYLGRRYRLKVIEIGASSVPKVRMRGAFIEVTTHIRDPAEIASALKGWHRQRAHEVFLHRLPVVAEPLRWIRDLPPIRLQFMKLQWGSCSPAGRITLNPWLVRAPRQAIDYVLLHEMCHLRHHNHSRAFYANLDRHLPNWRHIKAELDGRAEEFLRQ